MWFRWAENVTRKGNMNAVVRRNVGTVDDGAFWNTVLVFVLRFTYNEFKLFKRAA